MDASDVVLLTTACSRPRYLEESLASWGRVRGVGRLAWFAVALGDSDVKDDQAEVIAQGARVMGLDSRMTVLPDSPAAAAQHGMHRAVGEALAWLHTAMPYAAVILTEEDIEVSSDALEYFLWALSRWEHDQSVLTVCAHDEGGQGWHVPGIGARGAGRPQDAVRLVDDFNPWCWATWRSRVPFLLERWDWDATLGGPMPTQHGYDWQIRFLVHAFGLRSVAPDASRSQNIGRDGGVYAKPELFDQTLAASYRRHRDPTEYKVVA
jgi:GNT-I family protein